MAEAGGDVLQRLKDLAHEYFVRYARKLYQLARSQGVDDATTALAEAKRCGPTWHGRYWRLRAPLGSRLLPGRTARLRQISSIFR